MLQPDAIRLQMMHKTILYMANSATFGLAKGGLTCFAKIFVLKQTFGLRLNFCAKNPRLRKVANR